MYATATTMLTIDVKAICFYLRAYDNDDYETKICLSAL